MKLSVCKDKRLTGDADSAALLLEMAPLVTRVLRAEVRRSALADLSMPQFRVLAALNRHPGASLSNLAARVGQTLSSASKLIDALLARDLVTRAESLADRRRVTLAVTEQGRAALDAVEAAAHERLTELLSQLSDEERHRVAAALELLQPLLERGTSAGGEEGVLISKGTTDG